MVVVAHLFCVACVGYRFVVGLQASVLCCCLGVACLVLVVVQSFVLVVVGVCGSVLWCGVVGLCWVWYACVYGFGCCW